MATTDPVGAGDLGQVVQCLRDAAAALRESRWADALLHMWHVVDEVRMALAASPAPMMEAGASDALKAECACKADELEAAATRAEAAAIDWQAMLSMLLPLILRLLQR